MLSFRNQGSRVVYRLFIVLIAFFAKNAVSQVDDQKLGKIDVNVFMDNAPESDRVLVVNDRYFVNTDKMGAINFLIEAGKHFLRINFEDQEYVSPEFTVYDQQITQIIVNLRPGFRPAFDIEVPHSTQASSSLIEELNETEKSQVQLRFLSIVDQKPIAGVQVYVRGRSETGTSDADGLAILELPQGSFSFAMIHPNFSTMNLDDLPSSELATARIVKLSPIGLKLEEFLVIAPHLRGSLASLQDERRLSSQVTDFIGSEQMSKSGDSDAAAALRRVAGISLVDDRFVYIRGLGERYSSSLLNNLSLPSPDPSRRVVPLDMFPTAMLESIMVQKSYSADLPGEFGGGAVIMRSKSLPNEVFLQLSLASSIEERQSSKVLTYRGGRKDWTGYDDGTRALPELIANATKNGRELKEKTRFDTSGYEPEEIEAFGEALPAIYTPHLESRTPNIAASLALGNSFNLGDWRTGFSLSLVYGNEWTSDQWRSVNYRLPDYDADPDYQFEESRRDIKLGYVANFGVEYDEKHKLDYTFSLLRLSRDRTQIYQGINSRYETPVKTTILDWQERELSLQQLRGDHQLNLWLSPQITWGLGLSQASRYQPDFRRIRYQERDGHMSFITRREANQRIYADLEDDSQDIQADLKLTLLKGQKWEISTKLGFQEISKERDSQVRRFGFVYNETEALDAELLAQDLENIFSPENIGPNGFKLRDSTRSTDNYDASQELSAHYLMLRMHRSDLFDINIGQRFETSHQKVRTYRLFDPENQPVNADLKTKNQLPAVNLTGFISRQMQFRLGYSKTLARPDFKELSVAAYTDDEDDIEVVGNPNLQTTIIENFDARWEWYYSSNEQISIGVFYKSFIDPIEIEMGASENPFRTFSNADSAENFGLEFEVMHRLHRYADLLSDWKLGGNIALIESKVKLADGNKGVQTSNERPLQGQSPYIINAFIDYDAPEYRRSITLLYNVIGKRIAEIGTFGKQDIYEMPRPMLDLVYHQGLGESWRFSFRAKNLLASDKTLKQEGRPTYSRRDERQYSLGITANF